MKKILTITLIIFAAATTTQAQSHTVAHAKHVKHAAKGHIKATASATDDLSMYVGTNDANLSLIRQGIKKG